MRNGAVLAAVCVTVVLAAVVCGARSQPRQTSAPTKWEYRIESYAQLSGIQSLGDALEKARTVQELEALNNDMASRMTDLGNQGWELVCLQSDRSFIFERRIQ
jgi:hypothetical protein